MRKYSQACEENKEPILKILKSVFKDNKYILEIGSGTGQHAAYFSKHLPYLIWQPSDLKENHSSIKSWMEKEASNLNKPIELDISHHPWPNISPDGIFVANVFHIISLELITHFYLGVSEVMKSNGLVLIYGPFSYAGKHTSQSNKDFDKYLKQRDPLSGIRDAVDLEVLAESVGLKLIQDYAMPANNRCLLWKMS